MTNEFPTLFLNNSKLFDKSTIGYDQMMARSAKILEDLQRIKTNFPPYNILRKEDDKYVLEFAVVGFSEADISITVDNGKLTVSGKIGGEDEETVLDYVYKGIAQRAFELPFMLGEFIEVKSASLKDGMLRIDLEREVPDAKKPKSIKINE